MSDQAPLQWYYAKDGERIGPVKESELRQLIADGTLQPGDHVWNETMGEQWALVSDRPDLSAAPAAHQLPVGFPPVPGVSSVPDVLGDPSVPEPAHWSGPVSCRAAVRPAWERMKDILFRPFSMSKWFALGVSAWLAALGEGGGSSFSGNTGDFGNGDMANTLGGGDMQGIISEIQNFWYEYGALVLGISAVVILIVIVIAIFVAWLRARGKFMLLDNVVHNTAEIAVPWKTFAQHGRSLLGWYIVYGLVGLLIFAILGGIGFLTVILPCIRTESFPAAALSGLIGLGVLATVIGIAMAYISRFVEDFVIPMMYHFDLTVLEAWGRFRPLFAANRGTFIVYGLFYLLLTMAGGIMVLLALLATCCLGACLLIIPFVGTVALLPIPVFFRAYSLEYMAQFGPEYRVLKD